MHDGSVRSDDGPDETVAFYYGKLGGQTFDDLAVDPNNPNVDPRPTETPGPDDNVVGLPAVQTDNALADKDWIIVESFSSGASQSQPVTFTFTVSVDPTNPNVGGVIVASGDVDGTTDTFDFGNYEGQVDESTVLNNNPNEPSDLLEMQVVGHTYANNEIVGISHDADWSLTGPSRRVNANMRVGLCGIGSYKIPAFAGMSGSGNQRLAVAQK